MSKMIRSISKDGSVLCCAVDATDMIARMEQIHHPSAVVTAALGRLTIAASMMGSMLKHEDDSLTLRINGGGPCGTLMAVGSSMGNVKSWVQNPYVELPLNDQGKLDVRGAVGTDGVFSVVKDIGLKEPYIGQVPIVSGEIGEDVTSYYATSEQTPTACGLGVLVNPDLTVRAAGGYLIQLLPFADEACIDVLEENLKNAKPVSAMIDEGMTPEQICETMLKGLEPEVLDTFDASYSCDCSKERVSKALVSLGAGELEQMASDEKEIEVNCQFCDKKYTFSPAELRALAKDSKKL